LNLSDYLKEFRASEAHPGKGLNPPCAVPAAKKFNPLSLIRSLIGCVFFIQKLSTILLSTTPNRKGVIHG